MIDGLDKATGIKDELPLDARPLVIVDGGIATKSDLGIRPNYHREEARVDAHVFISVLAYLLWLYITYKLEHADDDRSWANLFLYLCPSVVYPPACLRAHSRRQVDKTFPSQCS